MRHRADGLGATAVSWVTAQRQFAHRKNRRFGDGGASPATAQSQCPHQTVRALPNGTTSASGVDENAPFCSFSRRRPLMGGACTELGELRRKMGRPDNIRLTRRDMLKLGAGGAGMFVLTAGGLAVPRGFAGGGGGGGGGSLYIEAFPTSPLILKPFNDPLTIPTAHGAGDPDDVGLDRRACPTRRSRTAWRSSDHEATRASTATTLGCAPAVAGRGRHRPAVRRGLSTTPLVYQIKLAGRRPHVHLVDGAADQQLRQERHAAAAAANANPRNLPESTIYGFNGTLPGPADQRRVRPAPSLVRFENHLDETTTATTARTSARRTTRS